MSTFGGVGVSTFTCSFTSVCPRSPAFKCVMYADDTTLLTSSSDPLTLETDLKRSLDMVANWFNFKPANSEYKEDKANDVWYLASFK